MFPYRVSFARLWAVQIIAHSAFTLSMPRRRNWRKPLACKTACKTFQLTRVRPLGWTVSINYFDRLLGVLIFELRGAEIAQRRM